MGFLTAGIVLAIMVVPFIISVSREVLLTVPREQREAALAPGRHSLGSHLEGCRAVGAHGNHGFHVSCSGPRAGETMAVTMVIGNDPKIAASLFAPGYTIAAVIANEFTEATGDLYLSALIELGLVLFLMTFILNGLARILIVATERGGGHACMSRVRIIWRKSLNAVMLTLTGVCALCRSCGSVPDPWLFHLQRRQVSQLGLSSRNCQRRSAKAAAAWPTPSWEA